jgi:hypothetical protein
MRLVIAMVLAAGLGAGVAKAQYPDPNEEIARQGETAGPAADVVLKCGDGTVMQLDFGKTFDQATLDPGTGAKIALRAQETASGIHYTGEGWDVRGKVDEHTVTGPDGKVRTCLAQN